MLEQFRTHINLVAPLSDEATLTLYSKMNVVTLRKKETLITEGARNNKVFFLLEGLIRIYTLNDGVERITDFIEPGYFVNILSQPSFIPIARACVVTMEPSVVLSVNSEELAELYESSVELANWGRAYAEKEVAKLNHFFSHLYFLSPTELYKEAVRSMSPQLLQKIPLKYIASYLNLAPESLSRIRKRIVTVKD